MEEISEEMRAALDRVQLDAEMRALAESAMKGMAAAGAEGPAPEMLATAAEEAGAAAEDGAAGATCALPAFAAAVPGPVYIPKAPFRLVFTFGSDGTPTSAAMEDPDFLWADSYEYATGKFRPRVATKTATVGALSLDGTIYLNVTLDQDGKYSSAAVGMEESGDMSVKLYVLENGKVKKDYRHALVTLGGGGVVGVGIVITQEPIAPTTDHPGGGVEITFQPTQDGEPAGQPTVVTLWNGTGGSTDLSDTPALDVVPSTGNASAGVATTASRQDHVHKMPYNVMLLDVNQTVASHKTFAKGKVVGFSADDGTELRLFGSAANNRHTVQYFDGSNGYNFIWIDGTAVNYGGSLPGSGKSVLIGNNANLPVIFPNTIYLGSVSSTRPRRASLNGSRLTLTADGYGDAYVGYYQGKLVLAGCGTGTTTPQANCVLLQVSPTLVFGSDDMRSQGQVALSAGWAHANTKSLSVGGSEVAKILASADVNIPAPPSRSVSFVGDIRYDTSSKQLQKRVDTLNLSTGVVTQRSWAMITGGQAVPHSTASA